MQFFRERPLDNYTVNVIKGVVHIKIEIIMVLNTIFLVITFPKIKKSVRDKTFR